MSQPYDNLREQIKQTRSNNQSLNSLLSPEAIDELERVFATHLRAELQALRERMPKHMQFKSRFIWALNYNDPALNAHNKAVDQALAALDEVISKYGSEGAA